MPSFNTALIVAWGWLAASAAGAATAGPPADAAAPAPSRIVANAASKPPTRPTAKPAGAAGLMPHGVRVRRAYGWWPVGPSRFVVWLGVEEPYLIDLQAGCRDLDLLRPNSITAHNRRILAHRDEVVGAGGRCRIGMIRRADPATLATLGIDRAHARPIAIAHLSVRRKSR